VLEFKSRGGQILGGSAIVSVLYRWLNHAAEEQLVERTGTRDKPFEYRLPDVAR
jgi:hypothetical protein